MKSILIALAAALALPSAAHAESAASLVGRLVRDGCMPIIKKGKMPKEPELPEGGVLMSLAEKTALQIATPEDTRAWVYRADNDRVVIELNKEGCNVFTAASGDETYLPAVEKIVAENHPRLHVERDEATPEANLRNRTYAVPLAKKYKRKGAIQKLDITYTTAAAAPEARMFFVGVLPSLRKE
jgi:hypothetical protein